MNAAPETSLLRTSVQVEKSSSPPVVEALFSEHGRNSNAFFSLYPGFKHFLAEIRGVRVMQGFVDTGSSWVGACEPLAPEECQIEALQAYFWAARSKGRFALAFPVPEKLARICREAGLTVFQIGSEPIFELQTWGEASPLPHENLRTVRSLQNKGAQVKETEFKQIPWPLLNQFESIRLEWLAAKRLPPLDFLNRVEPWALSGSKKYFYLQMGESVQAFIAAIPFDKGKSWYLVDVLRRSDAPAGSAELLLGESMKSLYAQGATRVSLGVAPLAQLDSKHFEPKHQVLFRLMNFSYNHGGSLYKFESLYDFKMKFRPTLVQPVFLVAPKQASLVSLGRAVSKAYFPKGLLRATAIGFARTLVALLGSEAVLKWVNPKLILRAAPSGVREVLERSRVSITAGIVWISAFLFTAGSDYHLKGSLADLFAFSWHGWMTSHSTRSFLSRIFVPGILHWDIRHLMTNLIPLAAVVLPFEIFAGSRLTLSLLLIGQVLANPLTGLIFSAYHTAFQADFAQHALVARDVGASLAVFSVLGGFLQLLKGAFWSLAVLSIAILGVAIGTHDALQINHAVALFLGAFFTCVLLKRSQIS